MPVPLLIGYFGKAKREAAGEETDFGRYWEIWSLL